MKSFTENVQCVWNTADIEHKRSILLDIVDNFQYKNKMRDFRIGILEANTGQKLDTIAKNILLADMKVI